MVLKVFIHYLLNKYLKNYVERFDHEKVKLNLKSGNIFLENLRLKPEALAYLNIPATISVGFIEQLKVTIPWNNLATNSTEVHIDGFYLLIVPKNEMAQDLSEHYADKSKRVQQKLEKLRKATLDNGLSDNSEMAFFERMRIQVMRNLLLTIRNLHISYEMKSPTKLGHPFSFGLTLYYLQVTTANNVNLNKRIKGDTLLLYQIKEMNSVSFYWNSRCKSRLDMPFDNVLNDLKSKIATNNYTPNDPDMKYVLRPINLHTESLITLKPKEHQFERSTLIFNIRIPQTNLSVDTEQISDILDFLKFQTYTTVYDRCREYRELLRQDSLGIQPLTTAQQQRIQFLESKLDIFHLAYIRHRLEMEGNRFSPTIERSDIEQEHQLPSNPISTDGQQQNRWNSWSKFKNSFNSLTKNQRKTSATPQLPNGKQPCFEDLPKMNIQIHFNQLTLNLSSPTNNNENQMNEETILSINLINAHVDMKRMSVTSQVECTMEFQSIDVVGMKCNQQSPPKVLVPTTPFSSSSSPLVFVNFELFSSNQLSDYRLQLIVQPIKVFYDARTVNQLIKCVEANGSVIWKPETEMIEHTETEMERTLSYDKIFDMTINFKGLSILLPADGVFPSQNDCSIIRITFGNLILTSCLNNNGIDTDNALFKKNIKERRFYTKYKLELSDLRIRHSLSKRKRIYILQRTPLIEINFYKCLFSNDTKFFNWCIGVKMVLGDIQLSKKILTKFIDHIQSIPFLCPSVITIIKRINFYFTLFSPYTTLKTDLSIYNCSLRCLIYPKTSILSDVHVYLTKNGNDTDTIILLNQLTMIQNISSEMKQSSRLFYRNEHIQLISSSSVTSLS